MPAGSTDNPGRRISFRIFTVGMVKGRETAAGAHLVAKEIS